MNSFLTPLELRYIKHEFKSWLNSAQANTIIIQTTKYTAGIKDEVYGIYTAPAPTITSVSVKGVQAIVTQEREDILRFGILKVGDSIFYFDPSVDLKLDTTSVLGVTSDEIKIQFVDPGGSVWNPVPRSTKSIYEYLELLFGNTRVVQTVPAKLQT